MGSWTWTAHALCFPALLLAGGPTFPEWWKQLSRGAGMEARFRQSSQSEVFGNLYRTGSLQLARPGKLRVQYDNQGICLISNGKELVQYDPATRTAQHWPLKRALNEMPLLHLLLDTEGLRNTYDFTLHNGNKIRLRALIPDLVVKEVEVEAHQNQARWIRWKDPSGARQEIELLEPRFKAQPSGVFTFQFPKGTRWL